MLDHVNRGKLTLARFVDLHPAQAEPAVRIAPQGPHPRPRYDADFTVVDLKRRRDHQECRRRARARLRPPYDGITVTGGRWVRSCAGSA